MKEPNRFKSHHTTILQKVTLSVRGPCDLRPHHLRFPSILRAVTSESWVTRYEVKYAYNMYHMY